MRLPPDHVPAGAPVATREPVYPSQGVRVRSPGEVALVTRTPDGADGRYLVRFADGAEASLTRGQFEPLNSDEQSVLPEAEVASHEVEIGRLRDALEAARDASASPEAPGRQTVADLNDLLVRVRLVPGRHA